MNIVQLLEDVATGAVSVEEARQRLEPKSPREYDLGFAKLDVDRESRCGIPEVVFGENC